MRWVARLRDAGTLLLVKVPKLGPLGSSFSDDLVLAPAAGDPSPGTLRQPTAFGDDIPQGRRIAVRVRLTSSPAGLLVFDYADSDPPGDGMPRLGITATQVERATRAAVNAMLGIAADSRRSLELFVTETDPGTWVGAEAAAKDEAVVAFGMARVFDAAMGAMANAWPSKVGAGSCTVGAIVRLTAGDESVEETLEGGEGATPTRAGQDQWASPLRAASRGSATWLEATEVVREGSGGVGARIGGCGIERRYTVTREVEAFVAIDRITNPPHGIDRAGPPKPAELWLDSGDGSSRRLAAWTKHTLAARDTLVVRTAGGAGHGFPGWGVDWDPDSF